jgi:hypothetical protein
MKGFLLPCMPRSTQGKVVFMAFPTSYLVESRFSWMTYLLSKVRNRLDIVKSDDLHLSLTSLQPAIQKLASVHQAQGTRCI